MLGMPGGPVGMSFSGRGWPDIRAALLWIPEGVQSGGVIIGVKFGNSGMYSCSRKTIHASWNRAWNA